MISIDQLVKRAIQNGVKDPEGLKKAFNLNENDLIGKTIQFNCYNFNGAQSGTTTDEITAVEDGIIYTMGGDEFKVGSSDYMIV